MKKFDIRKTFEIFLREPISVLTEGLFQLVNIENNIFSQKPYVGIDFVNKKTQITVVNSNKMYNLFQNVLFKQKIKEQKEKLLTSIGSQIGLETTRSDVTAAEEAVERAQAKVDKLTAGQVNRLIRALGGVADGTPDPVEKYAREHGLGMKEALREYIREIEGIQKSMDDLI